MNKRFLFFMLLFTACNSHDNTSPDVSGVAVNVSIQRFDRDVFAIDTMQLETGANKIQAKYPTIFPVFVGNILGLDQTNFVAGMKSFLRLSKPIADTAAIVFKNTEDVKKQFETAFKYVRYYFPSYTVPKIYTVLGPIDALAQTSAGFSPDFLGADFLGISLQFYLGKDYSIYQDPYFIDKVAPAFRSRRFSKEYIVADAMQLVTDDLFPDKSSARPLIEQMIERGKQWWLLDKFMPDVADSIKTGYTQRQLEWCLENEGAIWTQVIKNEDLYSMTPATIQTYIGEGPFTQGFPQESSPGNLGQWIGWRIVNMYAAKNPGKKPEEIMKATTKEILEQAKYKPK